MKRAILDICGFKDEKIFFYAHDFEPKWLRDITSTHRNRVEYLTRELKIARSKDTFFENLNSIFYNVREFAHNFVDCHEDKDFSDRKNYEVGFYNSVPDAIAIRHKSKNLIFVVVTLGKYFSNYQSYTNYYRKGKYNCDYWSKYEPCKYNPRSPFSFPLGKYHESYVLKEGVEPKDKKDEEGKVYCTEYYPAYHYHLFSPISLKPRHQLEEFYFKGFKDNPNQGSFLLSDFNLNNLHEKRD